MPDANAARRELQAARQRTDFLFSLVHPGALYDRPLPERHRIVFYIGHLEAFDWNLVARRTLGLPSFHSTFDGLFEFGIDPPPGEAPQDQPSDWPAIEEVAEYGRAARERVDSLLSEVAEDVWRTALEHREMHHETFAYMLHRLPHDRKVPPASIVGRTSGQAPESPMIEIPAGDALLGRNAAEGFGWDNEFNAHVEPVPAFGIQRDKVTNGAYLEFVREGAPAAGFWVNREGEWRLRTMFDEIPLPQDWPVWVTHEQAAAYAHWRGWTLPSEAHVHRAAFGTPDGGEADPPADGNCDCRHWDPVSVLDAGPTSPYGVRHMVGNGWEWTSTVFAPFDGFRPRSYYPGYSANFFDGEHYVLKGASPRTAHCFLRRSFRNWFRPNYPYVFAGFRCVES